MKADVLVAEIGSTTTVVSAFDLAAPRFLGHGLAPTTVLTGDVNVGLRQAIADLRYHLRREGPMAPGEGLTWNQMLATSSAAGGLRMTVHGLVYDMTVKAAREAALGAGAILKMVTAGVLGDRQLAHVAELRPNIILLAGGVDHGERATVVANARCLAELAGRGSAGWRAPVIFAGNVDARDEVLEILGAAGIKVFPVENVYPRIDELNVEPTRRVIQEVFEEHIVVAPGMDKIRQMVTGRIIPTPGAVMTAAQALYQRLGDLVVIDVGGATTDVHSVTEGSEEVQRVTVSPEPLAKRTVEGDLGVYLNARNIVELCGASTVARVMGEMLRADAIPVGATSATSTTSTTSTTSASSADASSADASAAVTADEVQALLARRPLFPLDGRERAYVEALTAEAVRVALLRHAGQLRYMYGAGGRKTIAEGKDLTRVRWLIGTGGPLTQLPVGQKILARIPGYGHGRELLPRAEARALVDRDYIMAACGVLCAAGHPGTATELLLESLGIGRAVEVISG